jgi:hypothetical protein
MQVVGIQKTGTSEALSDRIHGSTARISGDFTLLFEESKLRGKGKTRRNPSIGPAFDFYESPHGFAIVLGTINNASELRKTFGAASNSPAELIFYLCEKQRASCFKHIEGNLLAIVHVKEVKRDGPTTYAYRSSECLVPFYWIKSEPFSFATQLKDLICLGEHTPRLDHVGIAAYLHLGFFPMYLTPFNNIDKLTAGHVLTKTAKGYHALPAKEFKKPKKERATAFEKKATISLKNLAPFSWEQAVKDIWSCDLPTSVVFYPYLLKQKLGLKLRPLHPDKPIRGDIKKKPFWRGLIANFPPFSYLLWARANPYPAALREYQKFHAIFTSKELESLAPFTYSGFDLPSFMRKVFSQTLKKDFSTETFYEHEARSLCNLFDMQAKEHVSIRQVLAQEKWIDSYISDQTARDFLELIRAGTLKDQDIIDSRWMKERSVKFTPRIKKQLWSLATLEVWLQLFFEESPSLDRLKEVQNQLKEQFGKKEPVAAF